MSYAVLDIDLAERGREQLSGVEALIEQHEGIFALIRFGGRPVGKALIRRSALECPEISFEEGLHRQLEAAAGKALTVARAHAALEWSAGPPAAAAPKATVAVCTRERPEDLRRCLEALVHLPGDEHELLVVDNNPRTDATRSLVAEFAPRVRYVREDRPGLNAARNRALREASHDIVAFNDDDAEPDPSWLRYLTRNFVDPRVLGVTGLVMPRELETKPQEIFERHSGFSRGFRRRTFHGTSTDPLSVSQVGAGASMAVRRGLPDLVGPFDEALDAGTPTRSGGDHEMFYRILSRGYSLIYDPEAVSWHRHRRTMDELTDTYFGYGVGVYAYWCKCLFHEGEWRVVLAALYWLFGQQLPGLLHSAAGRTDSLPFRVALAELKGCACGPGAYLRSSRSVRKGKVS